MASQNSWNSKVLADAVTLNGGAIAVGTDATDNAIDIGTAAGAGRTVTIGNVTGTTAIAVNTGTGDFTLASATGTLMSALDTGEITKPLQPAFLATHSVAQDNATGAGTSVLVNFTTEVYDQNSDYDGTNTFTAPVSGIYLLTCAVRCFNITDAMTDGKIMLNTSNRNYWGKWANIGTERELTDDSCVINSSFYADMDAADTAKIYLTISNGAGDTVDLTADVSGSYFSCSLIC